MTWTWTTRTSGALMKLVRDVSHKWDTMWLHVLTWLKPRTKRTADSPRWRPDWLAHHFSRCPSFQVCFFVFFKFYTFCVSPFSSLSLSPCCQVPSWHRTTWVTVVRRCLSGVTVKAVGTSCRSACASCTCSTATFVCVSFTVPLISTAKSMFSQEQHNLKYQLFKCVIHKFSADI